MNRVYYLVLLLSLGLAFTACKGDKASSPDTATTTITTAPTTSIVPPATNTAATVVEHYTCPNGHAGYGAGQAGNCSQCNTPLVHNQAFHANDPVQTPAPLIDNDPSIPAAANTVTTAPTVPAQNAAGVFHYTCTSGCTGGAAGAGSCSTCGSALAHNQAYHN